MSKILKEIAYLASKHKLVPFLGAGCSINHLKCGWDEIRDELALQMNSLERDHLKIAQEYIDRHGKKAFCEFLKSKLLIDEFRDRNGFAHLAIMALGLGVIYTTNQDNVMERCLDKYGRRYKVIIELKDLAESTPGDTLYIKFHGDPSVPDSVVFGIKDYDMRISDTNHFLNIRLKSDLLAKSLFFVGYSFRDKNIRLIFEELKSIFGNKLPPSYMLAYSYSDELDRVCNEYGINLIDPLKEFPASKDNREAFEIFLTELVKETFLLKTNQEIQTLFNSPHPPTQRVISPLEIEALKSIIEQEDFLVACDKFRAVADQALIPLDYEETVTELFTKLGDRCSNHEESEALNAAAFNLRLTKKPCMHKVLVTLIVSANVRDKNELFYCPSYKPIPIKYYLTAIPFAIKHIIEKGDKITDTLRKHINSWIDYSVDISEFDLESQHFIKHWIDEAWKGPTTYEHPLKRKERLKSFPQIRLKHGNIHKRMMSLLPLTFRRPFEE
ncbi:SIR2 family NAD-dependent protein deacylase [Desulfofundulus thermocisternus]|uniref:SIR2 family NAD-dependent protein deacylase n=1 Tax=Desulfofundulus thermocisternus TaxID=42471 RepID=UPI00217F1509|nr:SIR2 family protein [Desulfofundulus thermocisternus]MCS5696916.1 SIR2 family protein [Desulfofundulus thermocisternus]